LFTVYLFALAVLFASRSEERRNLAVYTFDARGVSEIEAEAITDRIRAEISRADVYNVIERGLMEEVLEEQAFQLTGACTETSCLVEVGNLLAVHYMVGGSVTHIGNLYTIEARVIDIETGDIVINVIEDYRGPIENLLVQTTKVVAAKLIGKEEDITATLFTGTSDLLVKSNPPGGTIYIEDKPVGDVTPYRLEGLQEGEYLIQVRKSNLIGERKVSLARNDRKEIMIELKPEQFTIRVYSEPAGARVTINQKVVGLTPLDYTVTDTTIPYRVQLNKDLYFTIDDQVRFQRNTLLRLNYELQPCGRIEIPYKPGIAVFINDVPLNQLSNASIDAGLFEESKKRVIIDQLDLTEHAVRIEKQYHVPFETVVALSPVNQVQTVTPDLVLMTAEVSLSSPVPCKGRLGENPFSLDPAHNTNISVPFGDYTLTATTAGYLPLRKELALYQEHPDPIRLHFQRPDRTVALGSSLIYPGFGQFYSRQAKKGAILSTLMSASIVWITQSIIQYNKELEKYNEYDRLYWGASTIEMMDHYRGKLYTSRDRLTNYRNQFIGALALAAFTYVWNIIDITLLYPYED
jgi:TolB-like protein